MAELVFFDQRHPLKRSYEHSGEQPRQLPRLPSLSEWANLKPLARIEPPAAAPPPASTDESTGKAPTPMRNTSRERMKAEQAALRAQAALLETELETLRRIQRDRLRCNRSNTESSHGWQQAAQAQWEGRVEAERENKRLRTTVTSLASEVKSIESLFKSRSNALSASLKQHSLLALQLQALMAADDRETLKSEPSPTAKSAKHSYQQSPRDVSMESWAAADR